VAIFTGINLVYKEIEKKTIYNIISKPISRSSFILGKFLGLAFTLLVALLSMGMIFCLYIVIFSGSLDPMILVYFLYLYMELLIVTAISIVFSSFSTPILSSIFTLCLYIIGQVIWTYNLFRAKINSPVAKYLADFIYLIMPNFHKFNIKNEVVLNLKPELNLWATLGYAVFYICALLALAILIFSKKELK
jgi:ABC-type transport system involved in multi-copper enzyme maturation permease subunit